MTTFVKGTFALSLYALWPQLTGYEMPSKDPSGYSLSEGRIQAQWALRVTWVAQLDLRLSGAYSASQRLTLSTVGRQKIS